MTDDLGRELRERLGRATLPPAPASLRDEIHRLRDTAPPAPVRRSAVRPPLMLLAAAFVTTAVVAAAVGGALVRQRDDPRRDLAVISSPGPSRATPPTTPAASAPTATSSVPAAPTRPTPRLFPAAARTPRTDLCAGGTQLADIWDTSVSGNAMSNWTHGDIHPLDSVGSGAVAIVVPVSGRPTEVRILDPLRSRTCVLMELPAGDTADANWSPSGDALAIAASDGSLFVWSATGTTRPMVVEEPAGTSWSPDGSELAVDAASSLWVLPDTGATGVRLHCDPPGGSVECPAFPRLLWSPSGDRLVMTGGDRLNSANFGPASLTDPIFHRIDPVPGLEDAGPMGWLDSQTLVEGSDSNLYEVPIDDRSLFRKVDLPPNGFAGGPVFSPDQRLAAFGSFRRPVIIRDVATGREKVVVGATQLGPDVDYSLAWSSDNRSLVMSAQRQGDASWTPLGLWVVNADGSGLKKLMTGQVDLVSTEATDAQRAALLSWWMHAFDGPAASPGTP